MTVVLPTEEDQHRPFYRVLICNDWLHQTWVVLPMVLMASRLDVGSAARRTQLEATVVLGPVRPVSTQAAAVVE